MGIRGLQTRLKKVFQQWNSFAELLEHRESIRPCAKGEPICQWVTPNSILVDALSFIFSVHGMVPTSPQLDLLLRQALLSEYDSFFTVLTNFVWSLHEASNGAPIIFYLDGSIGSGSSFAAQQKEYTNQHRRTQGIQNILNISGYCSGEELETVDDIPFPRMLSMMAIETLREAFVRVEGGPNVHIVQCCGEADPYLTHDGRFAALVISDDTDFIMTPGITVTPTNGISFADGNSIIQTRDVHLAFKELGLPEESMEHLVELVSFVGNDYTGWFLEQPTSHDDTLREWLLKKAEKLSPIDGGIRPFIDRLAPLVRDKKALQSTMEFIRSHHTEFAEAIEFTRQSIYNPGQIVKAAMEESPEESLELQELPISVVMLRKGELSESVVPEDFSLSVPPSSRVVLPLTAALFATAAPSTNGKEKVIPSPKISYRVGIDFLEDRHVDIVKLVGPDYPIGPVAKNETKLTRITRLFTPLRHTLVTHFSKSLPVKLWDVMSRNEDDKSSFALCTSLHLIGLSAAAKDPLSISECLSFVTMLGILNSLASVDRTSCRAYLLSVTELCDSELLLPHDRTRGLSDTDGGFRDITLSSRFISIARAIRTLCVFCGVANDGGRNPYDFFHGPSFSIFLKRYSRYPGIEGMKINNTQAIRKVISSIVNGLVAQTQRVSGDESDLNFVVDVSDFVKKTEQILEVVNLCDFSELIVGKYVRRTGTEQSTVAASVDQLFDDSMLEVAQSQQEEGFITDEVLQRMHPGNEEKVQLPVAKFRDEILETVRANPVVVIEADTGAGKSSQVPQYLLYDAIQNSNKSPFIVCTQPRRISAITLAQRVAREIGEESGKTVSYAIGHDNQMNTSHGSRTRILYVTIGWLLQKLLANEDFFWSCSHIILDEVHERSIDSDLLTLLLRDLLSQALNGERKGHVIPPKLLLMSATVNGSLYANYFSSLADGKFGEPPILYVGGRVFPVVVHHLDEFATQNTLPAVNGIFTEKQWMNFVLSFAPSKKQGKQQQQVDVMQLTKLFNIASGIVACRANHVFSKKMFSTLLIFLPGMKDIENMHLELIDCCETYRLQFIHRTSFGKDKRDEVLEITTLTMPFVNKFLENEEEEDEEKYNDPAHMEKIIHDSNEPYQLEDGICGAIEVLVLHSDIDPEEQMLAFAPLVTPGVLRIVLSTNIAESSVTIPGVDTVIDFGLHREISFDQEFNVNRLCTKWIAQSSAIQRAGRAGRLCPGVVWRLYTSSKFESMPPYDIPEMLRLSLTTTVLRLKILAEKVTGMRTVAASEDEQEPPTAHAFSKVGRTLERALQAPDPRNVAVAVRELINSGALGSEGLETSMKISDESNMDSIDEVLRNVHVTKLGAFLHLLPLDMRIGRLVALGARSGKYLIHTIIMAVGLSLPLFYIRPNPLTWNSDDLVETCMSSQSGILHYDQGRLSDAIAMIPFYVDAVLSGKIFKVRSKLISFAVNLKRVKSFVHDVFEISRRLIPVMPKHRHLLEHFIDLHHHPRDFTKFLEITEEDANFLRLLIVESYVTTNKLFIGRVNLAQKQVLEDLEKSKQIGAAIEHTYLVKCSRSDVNPDSVADSFGPQLRPAFEVAKLLRTKSKQGKQVARGRTVYDYATKRYVCLNEEGKQVGGSSEQEHVICLSFRAANSEKYLAECKALQSEDITEHTFRAVVDRSLECRAFLSTFTKQNAFRVMRQKIASTSRRFPRDKNQPPEAPKRPHQPVGAEILVDLEDGDAVTFVGDQSHLSFPAHFPANSSRIDSYTAVSHLAGRPPVGPNTPSTLVCVAGHETHVESTQQRRVTAFLSHMTAIPDGNGLLALILLLNHRSDTHGHAITIQGGKKKKKATGNKTTQNLTTPIKCDNLTLSELRMKILQRIKAQGGSVTLKQARAMVGSPSNFKKKYGIKLKSLFTKGEGFIWEPKGKRVKIDPMYPIQPASESEEEEIEEDSWGDGYEEDPEGDSDGEAEWVHQVLAPYLGVQPFTLDPKAHNGWTQSNIFLEFKEIVSDAAGIDCDPFAIPEAAFNEVALSQVLSSMSLRFNAPDGSAIELLADPADAEASLHTSTITISPLTPTFTTRRPKNGDSKFGSTKPTAPQKKSGRGKPSRQLSVEDQTLLDTFRVHLQQTLSLSYVISTGGIAGSSLKLLNFGFSQFWKFISRVGGIEAASAGIAHFDKPEGVLYLVGYTLEEARTQQDIVRENKQKAREQNRAANPQQRMLSLDQAEQYQQYQKPQLKPWQKQTKPQQTPQTNPQQSQQLKPWERKLQQTQKTAPQPTQNAKPQQLQQTKTQQPQQAKPQAQQTKRPPQTKPSQVKQWQLAPQQGQTNQEPQPTQEQLELAAALLEKKKRMNQEKKERKKQKRLEKIKQQHLKLQAQLQSQPQLQPLPLLQIEPQLQPQPPKQPKQQNTQTQSQPKPQQQPKQQKQQNQPKQQNQSAQKQLNQQPNQQLNQSNQQNPQPKQAPKQIPQNQKKQQQWQERNTTQTAQPQQPAYPAQVLTQQVPFAAPHPVVRPDLFLQLDPRAQQEVLRQLDVQRQIQLQMQQLLGQPRPQGQ